MFESLNEWLKANRLSLAATDTKAIGGPCLYYTIKDL